MSAPRQCATRFYSSVVWQPLCPRCPTCCGCSFSIVVYLAWQCVSKHFIYFYLLSGMRYFWEINGFRIGITQTKRSHDARPMNSMMNHCHNIAANVFMLSRASAVIHSRMRNQRYSTGALTNKQANQTIPNLFCSLVIEFRVIRSKPHKQHVWGTILHTYIRHLLFYLPRHVVICNLLLKNKRAKQLLIFNWMISIRF